MPLSTPQQSGDILKPADAMHHMLVVAPTEYLPHVPNVNTKPGELSPAIRVNVADFSALTEAGQPAVYTGALWFNQALHSNLKRQIGEFVLGQLATGQATPGRNAPVLLVEVTDAAWVSHCSNWLDNTPEGEAFQTTAIQDTNRAAASAEVAQVAQSTPPPAVPAAAPVAPAAPATPGLPPLPTAPSLGAPPAGPPIAAPAPSAAPAVAPSAGLEALIAALPPEQQAAARALMGQQGQASS